MGEYHINQVQGAVGDHATANISIIHANVDPALAALCERLRNSKHFQEAEIVEIKSEQANLLSPDTETRKGALVKIWDRLKEFKDTVEDSEDIVTAFITLATAAGIALKYFGL